MRINLNDIPAEGKTFIINQKTGELNSALTDLIGKRTYNIEVSIRPLNTRDFEMIGAVQTGLPEQCSRCGIDFDFQVNSKIHEIMIPEQEQPRNGKYARVNHASEEITDGPSSVFHQDFYFDLAEYIHEVVALAVPFNPAPPVDSKGGCMECKLSVNEIVSSYDEEMPVDEQKTNPFAAALKGIKLN